MEMFSITIQQKLRSNSSAFNRYLRKYDELEKELNFDECKNEAKVMDDFRDKTIVTLIGAELRFFDPTTA